MRPALPELLGGDPETLAALVEAFGSFLAEEVAAGALGRAQARAQLRSVERLAALVVREVGAQVDARTDWASLHHLYQAEVAAGRLPKSEARAGPKALETFRLFVEARREAP